LQTSVAVFLASSWQFMLAHQPAAPNHGTDWEAAAALPPQKVNLATIGNRRVRHSS
jgi:hypothetical protein